MPITVIEGEQRGDEGKGRFVDMLAQEHDIVARFNGGPNAGHTVVLPDGRELNLHGLPSGVAYEHTKNVIGNGVYIDPSKLIDEIESMNDQGISVSPENLLISSSAHLILPHHIAADIKREGGDSKQGSTKSGISQVAADKYLRIGKRTEDINNNPDNIYKAVVEGLVRQQGLWETVLRELRIKNSGISDLAADYVDKARQLGDYITDTALFLNNELQKDQPAGLLAEGAQAFLLDIDQGMYPFTTSSSTTSGGVASGLGVPPGMIDRVIGVTKATQSHVGDGPFVTEIVDPDLLEALHGDMNNVDAECGTTTGRVRRLGNLDLPQIRRSQMINGTGEMALTKLDWIPRYGNEVPICVSYDRKGKLLEIAPDSARKLEQSTPNYEQLPTWQENIQDVRVFEDLPEHAQNYIEFIEEQTKVPITMIGVGPGRDQVITRAIK